MTWELFRDQIWNSIGVIIACITLIVTLIIYFLQKNKKGLSYEITAKNSLLTTREKIEGKIKILYDDSEVQNVNFIEIKITNTGNIGIPANDYERPIRFIFGPDTKILSSEIIKSNPDNLNTALDINQNEFIIQPVLMNSKDSITIKSIISNSTDDVIIVDARVKDVKKIKKQGESYLSLIFGLVGIVLTMVGLIQLTSYENVIKIETPWTIQKYLSVGLIVLGYIFMGIFLYIHGGYNKLILMLLEKIKKQ